MHSFYVLRSDHGSLRCFGNAQGVEHSLACTVQNRTAAHQLVLECHMKRFMMDRQTSQVDVITT